MVSFKKAALFGFLIWLIPFIVSIIVFPLRESWRALFESIMPVVVTLSTVFFGIYYYRIVKDNFVKEGVYTCLLWLVICLVIDIPLMVSAPINMTLVEYLADIGLTYLIIPAITIGMAMVLQNRQSA